MNMRGACGFAHRLSDLLPPREVFQEYLGVWNNGVDRFYGQDMPVEQLDRIKKYYNETHPRDKPVWAYALKWFYAQDELGMYARFEWDFGIWQDALSLQRGRIQDRLPFVWASVTTKDGSVLTLPHALRLRREAMQGYLSLYHAIAAGPPGPPPMTSVVSGQQDDGVQEESRAGICTAVDAGSGLAYDAVSSTAPFPEEALSSANKLVSAAEWLDAGQEEGIQEPAEEVPDVQDGMTSSTAVLKFGGRTRWRRKQVVCIAADGGEGEARIVELDDKEDGLVASENGIAILDV